MLRQLRKGQSTAEYAIVIGLVIAAAVAMQVYVKRGIQAKIKGVVDYQPPTPNNMFVTGQYEPDYSTSNMTSSRTANIRTETKDRGEVVRTIEVGGEVSKSSGTQKTLGLNNAGVIVE